MKVNNALIKIYKNSDFKNLDDLGKATGIDKSTVSLHMSGKRVINLASAELYAKTFKVPLIKIISDEVVKYPIVYYCNFEGEVRLRGEDENEALYSLNEIENNKVYGIYCSENSSVYLYNKTIKLEIINANYFISTTEKKYIAKFDENKKFINLFNGKYIEDDVTSSFLITSIISTANPAFKLQSLL